MYTLTFSHLYGHVVYFLIKALFPFVPWKFKYDLASLPRTNKSESLGGIQDSAP